MYQLYEIAGVAEQVRQIWTKDSIFILKIINLKPTIDSNLVTISV